MKKRQKPVNQKDLVLFLQKCIEQNYRFLFVDEAVVNLIANPKLAVKNSTYNYSQLSIQEIIKVFSNKKNSILFKGSAFDRTYLCFDLLGGSKEDKRIRIYVDGIDDGREPEHLFYIKALFFLNLPSQIEALSLPEAFEKNLLDEQHAKFFILNMNILLEHVG
jgi:hypothetical protein